MIAGLSFLQLYFLFLFVWAVSNNSCVSVVANLMGLFLNYRYITFATAMEAGWRLSVHVGPDFSKELWCVIMNT